jgi:hypothetical protein
MRARAPELVLPQGGIARAVAPGDGATRRAAGFVEIFVSRRDREAQQQLRRSRQAMARESRMLREPGEN